MGIQRHLKLSWESFPLAQRAVPYISLLLFVPYPLSWLLGTFFCRPCRFAKILVNIASVHFFFSKSKHLTEIMCLLLMFAFQIIFVNETPFRVLIHFVSKILLALIFYREVFLSLLQSYKPHKREVLVKFRSHKDLMNIKTHIPI